MKLTLRFELEADDDAVALLRQFLPVMPTVALPAESLVLATPQWAPTSPFWAEPMPPPADPPACVEPDPLATKLAIDLGRRPTAGELAHARREAQTMAPDETTPPTDPPTTLPAVEELRAGHGVTVARLNEQDNLELVTEVAPIASIRLGPAALAALATGKAPVDPDPAPTVAPPTSAPAEPKTLKTTRTAPTRLPAQPVDRGRPVVAPRQPDPRQPSVNRVGAVLAADRQASGAELSWDLFDALVRKEVDRLAPVPGQMPSHAIWNTQRDPQLPTLTTIQTRYGVPSVEALAQLLGFTPPPRGPRPASVEAAHA